MSCKRVIYVLLPTVAIVWLAFGYAYFMKEDGTNDTRSVDMIGEEMKETRSTSSDVALDHDTQYLVFQLTTNAPMPGGQVAELDKARLRTTIEEIVESIDVKGDGKKRQLGFTIGPLSLDMTDEQMRETISTSFDLALEHDVAVAFHIDDAAWWKRRSDLWTHSDNIEWVDWEGTVASAREPGWRTVDLAPQMCYNSPQIKAEIGRIAREVIGAEIAKGIATLNREHKEYLFAGVIAGWEMTLYDVLPNGQSKGIGYCAVSNKGYSRNNPPEDFDLELETVVHEFGVHWTKNVHDGGVPTSKIYTHMPVTDQHVSAPPWTAFNEYSRAGFSLYSEVDRFDDVYRELGKQEDKAWALAEGTNLFLVNYFQGGTADAEMSWETYLAKAFNHGATLVNIFGWQEHKDSITESNPFSRATESKEAIEAYRTFLRGEVLQEGETRKVMLEKPDFQKELEQLMVDIQQYASMGGDMTLVEQELAVLTEHMKKGDIEKIQESIIKIQTVLDN